MGITGLLPFVRNSCRAANIKDFSGATVAVDAYSWLHKGAFSCAEKLVKGEKTDGYVYYCIKQLNLLLEAGLRPIMIFDGCNLSSKEGTEKKRRENREKTRQRGKELLCEGKIKEARECFQRCVDVTPEMAREVIQACRKKSIDCIVAPYEADAQLAYLDKIKMVQLIITEDSDLILFGCDKIFFKMDSCGGGLLYEKENLPKSFGSKASKFSFEKFRYMCILSGCDYLSSLPGIGLAKACKFFTLTNNMDVENVLLKLPCYLKMPKLTVSSEYIESFIKANNTFLYQLVFCPQKKTLVPLNPYPEDIKAEDMEYAGKYLPHDLAYKLAMGDINVKTFEEFGSSAISSSPAVDEDKSVVWGSQSSTNSKTSNKFEISAFKFSTPNERKKKAPVQKRSLAQTIDCGGEAACTDEELFSMYGSSEVKRIHLDSISSEEDPLADADNLCDSASELNASQNSPHPKLSGRPFRRIVRSRFFVPETKTDISPSVSVPEESQPKSETLSANYNRDEIPEVKTCSTTDNLDFSLELKVSLPKKSDKENIAHRFAKKNNSGTKQNALKSSSCGGSHIKEELKADSWLNILDNECSSATSTISSTGESTKLLDMDCAVKSDIYKTTSKAKKVCKKFIATKIEDFKLKKNSIQKTQMDNSLGSDGNSINESYDSGDEKSTAESVISPYFNPLTAMNQGVEAEKIVTVLSDSEESSLTTIENKSDTDILIKKGLSTPKNKPLKSSSTKSNRTSRCRTLGLSKDRKSCDKVPKKETLLNFNFVRQPKKDMPAVL